MNCDRIQELYTDLFEKTLSGTLLEAAEHHFRVCTNCRTDYAKFVTAMHLLDVEPPEIETPQSFRADILARIEAQPRKASAAALIWQRFLQALSPGEQRLHYQLVSGFAVVAVVAAALIFSKPAYTPGPQGCIIGSLGCTTTIAPPAPQYTGMFRAIATNVGADGRTYHDFTLHLPSSVANGAVDAYVIDDDKPLLDDGVLSDDSSVTPLWNTSQALDAGHMLNVPVAVVSDVTTLNLMVRETNSNGGEEREAAFVPLGADHPWDSTTVPAGTGLFDTLQTIAAAGLTPIVLENSVISMVDPVSGTYELTNFQSAPMPGGEPNEMAALKDALQGDPHLSVVANGSLLAVVAKP